MSSPIHRHGDARSCGASTIVSGQSSVFVNGVLWAVEGDQNSHGAGALVSVSGKNIFIESKKAIIVGDSASSDLSSHSSPIPIAGSSSVFS